MCSKTFPINNKDKYISDFKNDYIINSELKNLAGNIAIRNGKLMGVLSFIIITAANLNLYKNIVNEVEKETNDIKQELVQELEKNNL